MSKKRAIKQQVFMFRRLLALFVLSTIPLLSSTTQSFNVYPSMGEVYHPVSTDNSEAQQAFNRGLLAIYAFNHDAAYEGFSRAAELVDGKKVNEIIN